MPSMNDKIGGADQLDLGAIIQQPMKDPDWLKKCVLIGLMCLVPIAGFLNLSGWMKTIAEKHLNNAPDKDILPEPSFDYLGSGWRMFLTMLPLVGLLMAVMVGGGVVAGVMMATGGRGGEQAAMAIILMMYAGIILLSLAMNVVMPAIYFLHIVEGEPWASLQFKRIWEVMKEGGTQYLLLFVAVLIAGMIGSLGVIACYFGMFVTIPMGQAMMGKAIADYARMIRPTKAGFDVGGGVGGNSGAPFAAKN